MDIPKDKRKKLDPTSTKGIFVGYSASLKTYRIYIKENHQLEARRDVIFDVNVAYKRSKDILVDYDEEEVPIFEEILRDDNVQDHISIHEDVEEPSELVQHVVIPKTRKKLAWLKTTLQEAEGHATTKRTFRESKRPKRYFGYAAYMTKLIEAEPSSCEDATKH